MEEGVLGAAEGPYVGSYRPPFALFVSLVGHMTLITHCKTFATKASRMTEFSTGRLPEVFILPTSKT